MTLGERLDKLYADREYYEDRIDDLNDRLDYVFNEQRRERLIELLDRFEERRLSVTTEIEELEREEEQKNDTRSLKISV